MPSLCSLQLDLGEPLSMEKNIMEETVYSSVASDDGEDEIFATCVTSVQM